MGLPLADIKVADFTQVLAGPTLTMLLADQGAQVIKVEPPEGDSTRQGTPIPGTNDLTPGFLALNRNKRSMVVDVSKPKGRELVHRLAQWADVLTMSLPAGTPKRLGIAYEDLAPINPRLIYASLTSYGERGPDAALPGYDVAVQAKSGTMAHRRLPDGTPVPTTVPYYNDMSTAMLTAYAIMTALWERQHTGRGQKVEANILHTALALQAPAMVKVPGPDRTDELRTQRFNALLGCYPCSDGKYLHLVILTDRQWRNVCRGLGLEDLVEDPTFDTRAKRIENAESIVELISNILITGPAAEWEATLKASSAIANVVKESAEVFDDPQVVANQMFGQYTQPGLGLVTVINTPFRLSASADEPRFRRPAPTLGQHTAEVLKELGYSPQEIRTLKAEGVVG